MPDHLIRLAEGCADIALARQLFQEYQAGLGVDLCFQGFAQELAGLPGAYTPPRGCLLLAGTAADPHGCAALRPLEGAEATPRCAEMKRLYVRPQARGRGLGRALALAILAHARAMGYREIKLDTLAQMQAAGALYAALGFRECPAYYRNPLGGTLYMALTL
jgi:putative acetyltransferase